MKRKAWKKRLAFLCALLIAGQLLSSAAFAGAPVLDGNNDGSYTVTIEDLEPGEQVAIFVLDGIHDGIPGDFDPLVYFMLGKLADLNQVAAGSDGKAVYTTPDLGGAEATVFASSPTLTQGPDPVVVAYAKDLDTGDLRAAIAAAKSKIDKELERDKLYTTSSVAALEHAIGDAEYVLSDPHGEQYDVGIAEANLVAAVGALVPKGDAAELLKLAGEANAKIANAALYKPESFATLDAALIAYGLLDLDDASQADADAAAQALQAGIEALELIDEIQSASKSLRLLLGNVAGFDGNSGVFVDATALEAAIATANALPVEAAESEILAAYAGVIGAVNALSAKPEYGYFSLIQELKGIAAQNYDEGAYTAESWAAFGGAIDSAWALITAGLSSNPALNQIFEVNEINRLKTAEQGLARKPAIIPQPKDINMGVYALTDRIKLISERLNPDADGAVDFEFTGAGLQNVGTAQFIVHFPKDKVANVTLTAVNPEDIPKVIELANPNPADYTAGVELYTAAIPGYYSFKVWLHAIGSGSTFSVTDGDPVVTVRLKIAKAQGIAKVLEPGPVSLLFSGAEIDYYDTAVAAGDIRIAYGLADPAYATTLVELMSRFDINEDGYVDSADIEAVRNLMGAYKLGGVWYMGANPLSGADAARAALADLDGPGGLGNGVVDGVDLTLVKAAWEARHRY